MISGNYVLRMEGVSKSYSGVPALCNVNLRVSRGEVHAVMGENGAGKSTLMKILSGLVPKDQGEIYLDDCAVDIKSSKTSLGISMIHQEFNPVRAMMVYISLVLILKVITSHRNR
jgi:ABC-type sugar transport system ATPase subunit